MTDLPRGWEEVRTDEAGQLDLGRQRAPKYHSGPNMKPYLRVANVFEDRIDTSDVKVMHFEPEAFERSKLHIGDVLLNEGQSPQLLGRPAIYRGDPEDVAFTNSLIRFRPTDAVTPEWALAVFRHHMHSGRFARESRITTNIAHLSASRLAAVEFRVPPLAEQRRIVAAMEEAFSKLDAGEAGLRTVQQLLKRMRDAVLAAAVTGRVVPQDPTDAPITELLADLDQGAVGAGVSGLPGWTRVCIGDLAEVISGPAFKSSEFGGAGDGIPLLRGENIEPGALRWTDTRTWPANQLGGYEHLYVDTTDIILAMDRPVITSGLKIARVRPDDVPALLVQRVARIRIHQDDLRDFVWLAMLDRRFIAHLLRGQVGTQLPHISLRDVRSYEIGLPPLAELRRVVAEAHRQLSFIGSCEGAVNAGLVRSAVLRRSVLKAAFDGRLVPQDLADEPASALLGRVLADRTFSGRPVAGFGERR